MASRGKEAGSWCCCCQAQAPGAIDDNFGDRVRCVCLWVRSAGRVCGQRPKGEEGDRIGRHFSWLERPHVSEFETGPEKRNLCPIVAPRCDPRIGASGCRTQDQEGGRLDENLEKATPSRNGWPMQGCWDAGMLACGMAGTRGNDPEALAQTPGWGYIWVVEWRLRCRCRCGHDGGSKNLGNGGQRGLVRGGRDHNERTGCVRD